MEVQSKFIGTPVDSMDAFAACLAAFNCTSRILSIIMCVVGKDNVKQYS